MLKKIQTLLKEMPLLCLIGILSISLTLSTGCEQSENDVTTDTTTDTATETGSEAAACAAGTTLTNTNSGYSATINEACDEVSISGADRRWSADFGIDWFSSDQFMTLTQLGWALTPPCTLHSTSPTYDPVNNAHLCDTCYCTTWASQTDSATLDAFVPLIGATMVDQNGFANLFYMNEAFMYVFSMNGTVPFTLATAMTIMATPQSQGGLELVIPGSYTIHSGTTYDYTAFHIIADPPDERLFIAGIFYEETSTSTNAIAHPLVIILDETIENAILLFYEDIDAFLTEAEGFISEIIDPLYEE